MTMQRVAYGAAILYGAGMTCGAVHLSNELQRTRVALSIAETTLWERKETLATEANRPHTIATQDRALRTVLSHARERTEAGDLADAEVMRRWVHMRQYHRMCAGAAGDYIQE